MSLKIRKFYYPFIFFLGLILIIFEIEIFRNTIIDLNILMSLILLSGLLFLLFDFKNYKKTYNYNGLKLYFNSIINFIVGYGFTVCSIFMFTNYYFASDVIEDKEFKIIKRSSLPGGKNSRDKRKPTFTINFEGQEKELVFKNEYYETMDNFGSIEISVQKGYFGFYILKNKKLIPINKW
jgi:hypothetical protein